MGGQFMILKFLSQIIVSRSVTRPPHVEIHCLAAPRIVVTLSISIFAGISLGTKLFSFASMGINESKLEADHRDERCNKEDRDRIFCDLDGGVSEKLAIIPRLCF